MWLDDDRRFRIFSVQSLDVGTDTPDIDIALGDYDSIAISNPDHNAFLVGIDIEGFVRVVRLIYPLY